MTHPIRDLPEGYAEVRKVILTEPRLLLKLNFLSLIPLFLMVIWMAFWWILISPSWLPGSDVHNSWLLLGVILGILIVFPFHELVHGLTIRYFGDKVRYGAMLSKGILYVLAENALFRRNEYVAVVLAPFVGITLLVMMLMLVLPQWLVYCAAIAAAVNASGAVSDFWVTRVVLGYPSSALVRDEADGFRIYAPLEAAGSSTQKREPPSAG